jgi:hypothetical protein
VNSKSTAPSAEQSDAFFQNFKRSSLPDRPTALALSSRSFDTVDAQEERGDAAVISKESPLIIAFADGVTGENRQAVMNSTQISERYANASHDLNSDPIGWHTRYKECMGHCGWFMTGHNMDDHRTSNTSITMDAVVLDIIRVVAGPNVDTVMKLMGKVFDSLKTDEPIINLFDRNSKSDSSGNARIVPCMQSASGIAVTYFVSIQCDFNRLVGGAWFWKWDVSDLKIKKMATGVNLNLQHYRGREQAILENLGASSDAFFNKLKLK